MGKSVKAYLDIPTSLLLDLLELSRLILLGPLELELATLKLLHEKEYGTDQYRKVPRLRELRTFSRSYLTHQA